MALQGPKDGIELGGQPVHGTKSPQPIYFRLSVPFWLRSGPNQIRDEFGGETQAMADGD